MIPPLEELTEKMAEAIWEADPRKGASWKELLVLNAVDGYLNAKTTLDITRKQAAAAAQALLESLPQPSNFDWHNGEILNVSGDWYMQLMGMKK